MRRPEWATAIFATRLKRDTLACLGKTVNKCVTRGRPSPAFLPTVARCESTLSRDSPPQSRRALVPVSKDLAPGTCRVGSSGGAPRLS